MTARDTLRLGLFAIVAFAVGLVVSRAVLAPRSATVPKTESATILSPARDLPTFQLVDQDGRSLPPDFLRHRWSVVFFGFTHCPDVCPTTLATLAQFRKQLTALAADEQPRVVFVSVDPERDTPQHIKEYIRFFDPSFIGATGTPAAVRKVANAFSVPFIRVPLPDGGYTVDHGAGVFVIAPSGRIVAYASPPLAPDVLARDYRQTVQYVLESS
jgi:protein SCO1/2